VSSKPIYVLHKPADVQQPPPYAGAAQPTPTPPAASPMCQAYAGVEPAKVADNRYFLETRPQRAWSVPPILGDP
jgi:hypothetical protein